MSDPPSLPLQLGPYTEAELPRITTLLATHRHHWPTVWALQGLLGAGKTTFTRALVAALGGNPANVSSPTYSLINTYGLPAGEQVHHMDFYRLEHPEEAAALGLEEYFAGPGLCLVEWPERIAQLFPESFLHLRFSTPETGCRLLEIHWQAI